MADAPEILTWLFADAGAIPNNPSLPLVVYRQALNLSGGDPSGPRLWGI